ncbi:MAG: YDG domain-containing protein [Actinomycetota bacterium]
MRTTGNARTRAAARAIGILTSAALVFGAMPAAFADTPVTVTVGIQDKTYDGTDAATITGCTVDSGVTAPDSVTCNYSVATATFADANVGNAISVNVSGLTLDTDGGNTVTDYVIGTVNASGNILKATLTAVLTADDKTYDGTDAADATCSVAADPDLVGADAANVACDVDSATFADANVGNVKTVNSTVSLSGTKSGNYQLASATPSDTANITSDVAVAYTGDTYLVTSSTVTANLAALLTAESSICLLDDTGDIAFAVEDVLENPVTVGSVSYPTATTATAAITVGPGIYTVEVTYGSSDPNCASASDAAVLTVVSAGGAANGGGWYRKSAFTGEGSSRANFGFVLNKTYSGTGRNKTWSGYKGQFVWVTGAGWRIKAALAGGTNYVGTFTCPAGVGATGSAPVCAAFQATGRLEQWDATLNGGLGDWAYVEDVTFTVTVYDGGTVTVCKRKACSKTEVADWFGIEVVGYTFAELPETGPVTLVPSGGKGSIKATL